MPMPIPNSYEYFLLNRQTTMSMPILMLTPISNYFFYQTVDADADARFVQSISLPDQNISSSVTNISPSIYRYFISVYVYPPPPFTLCLSTFAVILTLFMVFPSLFKLLSSVHSISASINISFLSVGRNYPSGPCYYAGMSNNCHD